MLHYYELFPNSPLLEDSSAPSLYPVTYGGVNQSLKASAEDTIPCPNRSSGESRAGRGGGP
jgi:hypothetical protein